MFLREATLKAASGFRVILSSRMETFALKTMCNKYKCFKPEPIEFYITEDHLAALIAFDGSNPSNDPDGLGGKMAVRIYTQVRYLMQPSPATCAEGYVSSSLKSAPGISLFTEIKKASPVFTGEARL